jgi:enamine deaminase RidA (YjgF/YER057c/UK114 family)
MSHEARLTELNLELPPAIKAIGLYRTILVSRGIAHLSGHGPVGADGSAVIGKLGESLDVKQGYEAARRTALNVLATLRQELGSLDKIRRIIKTTGFVNSTPDFIDAPAVINGFSEVMRDVFGPEAGIGARSSLNVVSLPVGWAVEIELLVELVD